jgi:D-alanyl-D-alanine carboxypeptidase (penicillin-binding protein 5/6)
LLLVVAAVQYLRPIPAIAAAAVVPASNQLGTAPALPWPARGKAALYLDGYGPIGTSGDLTPGPIASTAKMMTALLVLEGHPLKAGEQGPVITVTRADVAMFNAERNQGASVLPVVAGEQLTEYQLLQGLLLPSASNFADMLATWDRGSVAAFVNRMNARAVELNMGATHFADPSGFSAQSVSIPADLVTLGRTAMQLPVFAAIVSQTQATLPVAGLVHNLDALLGQLGVVGIKTGHTDQAGGCFAMAADLTIDTRPARIYGAVMGQPNALPGAFATTRALLQALTPVLHSRTVVSRGDVVARYQSAWGESGAIIAADPLIWILVDGSIITRQVRLDSLPSALPANSRVGTLVLTAGEHRAEVPLVTAAAINGPDPGWRLTRGF